jgi:tetratricopeptide (TPR) repeat protein
MPNSVVRRSLVALVILGLSINVVVAQSSQKPLRASEVMALQAGGVLPENLARDIGKRGLNFHPDGDFLGLMTKAGAEAKVLTALSTAKVTEGEHVKPDRELLAQLSDAAVLMKNGQYADAGAKLNEALEASFARMEAGFVMAELLRRVEEFGKASEVYAEILQQAPDFPEVHDKASYILYRLGDHENALSEAKAALAENPNDAEAHKNAGLALESAQRQEAAIAEYKEALRLKPDYAVVHYDIGLLYYRMHSYPESIVEYRKAIALDPKFADSHSNLGQAYLESGNAGAAIGEFREAKRLEPKNPVFRQNLSSALMQQDPHAAILELRELEQKFPDFEMCHVCLGNALSAENDDQGAEAEYRTAIKLAPEDADAHVGLGDLQKKQKNYDAALVEYRTAERVEPNSPAGFLSAGRALLEKKDCSAAVAELKQAVALAPSTWQSHELYGQALEAAGDPEEAITELKDAIALDPRQGQVMTELGAALEKKGDWAGALEQYRKGALTDSARVNKAVLGEAVVVYEKDPQKEYAAAQKRFAGYVESLKAAGKNNEAAELGKRVQTLQNAGGTLEKEQAALQAGDQAMRGGQAEEAETQFKQAVELAEHLPPGDDKLAVALGKLGQAYAMRRDMPSAEAVFHRQLTVIEKTFGPTSPRMTDPLFFLGMVAAQSQNYGPAESYLSRAVEINVRAFGENSSRAAESMRALAGLYMAQSKWEKAEIFLVRAVKAVEGPDHDGDELLPLWGLCDMYERWGKTDKAELCWDRAKEIMDKQYGKDSPNLVKSFATEADVLRRDGKTQAADMLEERVAKIRQTAQH